MREHLRERAARSLPADPAAAADLESLLEPPMPAIAPDGLRDAAVLVVRSDSTPERRSHIDRVLFEAGCSPIGGSRIVQFGSLVRRRLPRRIDRADYPLVGGPYWRAGDFGPDDDAVAEGGFDDGAAGSLAALTGCRVWIFHEKPDRRTMDDLLALIDLLPSDRRPVRLLHAAPTDTPRGGRLALPLSDLLGDAQDRRVARHATDRFLWAYEVNFRALVAPALVASMWERLAPRTLRAMCDPWAMAVLFAIRRQGTGEEVAPAQPVRMHGPLWCTFPGMVFERIEADVMNVREATLADAGTIESTRWTTSPSGDGMAPGTYRAALRWTGTGRHPALDQGTPGGREAADRYWGACLAVLQAGLAHAPQRPDSDPGDGPYRFGAPAVLTPAGRAFLARVHDALDDPDLPLRWLDEDGRAPEWHVPAMDRWINGTFRKAKRYWDDMSREDRA